MVEMLIAGERTAGEAAEALDVVDPATGETIESVPRAGAQDVDSAVQAADKAFAEWSRTDAEDRAILLRKAIALIERDRKDLVNSLVHEQGKPVTEAGGEVHHLLHGLNYYADLATKVRGSYQALPSALSKAYGMVLRRPMGVVAAIVPNNFPLTLLGTKLAPALMAGNTLVVKPAGTTPLTIDACELSVTLGSTVCALNVQEPSRRSRSRFGIRLCRITAGLAPSMLIRMRCVAGAAPARQAAARVSARAVERCRRAFIG